MFSLIRKSKKYTTFHPSDWQRFKTFIMSGVERRQRNRHSYILLWKHTATIFKRDIYMYIIYILHIMYIFIYYIYIYLYTYIFCVCVWSKSTFGNLSYKNKLIKMCRHLLQYFWKLSKTWNGVECISHE